MNVQKICLFMSAHCLLCIRQRCAHKCSSLCHSNQTALTLRQEPALNCGQAPQPLELSLPLQLSQSLSCTFPLSDISPVLSTVAFSPSF